MRVHVATVRSPGTAVQRARRERARAFLGGTRADLRYESTHHSLTADHVRFHHLAPDGTVVVDRDVTVSMALGNSAQGHITDDHAGPFRVVGDRAITDAAARDAAIAAAPAGGSITDVAIERVALPIEDTDDIVPGWRAYVRTAKPAHRWEIRVDGGGRATVARDHLMHAPTGYVYDPNPIAQNGDLTLVDNNGATSTELDGLRISVPLANLDGSHVLRGTYVDARTMNTAARATSPTDTYQYDRSSLHFDETMVYYHLDRAQTHITSLGFTNANHRQQVAIVDAQTDDNSFYDDGSKAINYGTGGVDDAQDADVITHEYGHAIQDNIVPGWGASNDSAAMGEGWGDIDAASNEPVDAAAHPMMVARECLATWDATSYDSNTPPCLRRLDGTKHYPESTDGEPHDDGEIWSAAQWEIYGALGDHDLGMKLLIESFFGMSTRATMQDQANSMVAADTALNGGAHVDTIRKALWKRGLDRVPLSPTAFGGAVQMVPVSLGPVAPIPNKADDSVTIHQAGAAAISVHYSVFNLERKNQCFQKLCDWAYVFDGSGHLYQAEGDNLGAHDSVVVPGDTVVVRWVTNATGNSVGLHIDRLQLVGDVDDAAARRGIAGCGAAGARRGAAGRRHGDRRRRAARDEPGRAGRSGNFRRGRGRRWQRRWMLFDRRWRARIRAAPRPDYFRSRGGAPASESA